MFSMVVVDDCRDMVKRMWEKKPDGMVSMMIMSSDNGRGNVRSGVIHYTKKETISLLDAHLKSGHFVINPKNIWEVKNPAGGKGFLFPLQDRILEGNMTVNPMCVGYGKLVSANFAIFTTDADVVAKARDFSTKCGEVDDRKIVRKTKTTKKE